MGYAKKLTGGIRADQDQLLCPFHEFDNLFREIGNAFNLNPTGTALTTRSKCVAGDPRAGRRCDAASCVEAAFLQCSPTDQHHGLPARSKRRGGLVDRLG